MSYLAIPSNRADLLPLPQLPALRVRKCSASNTIMMNSDSKDKVSFSVSRPPLDRHVGVNDSPRGLELDMLRRSDKELEDGMVICFDQYVVREADVDQELWEAAWLRAESQWEDRTNDRYAHSYKKKFAEQEFNALRKQCKSHHGLTFKCIVAVKKELDVKPSAIKSVLGTLDFSIRMLLQGETFPGEKVKAPLFSNNNMIEKNKYGYVCNVCVAGSARRLGIASSMMHLAIALARIQGLKEVYVHVHRNNVAAQGMYQKLGFEMVETAASHLSVERIYLLCLKI